MSMGVGSGSMSCVRRSYRSMGFFTNIDLPQLQFTKECHEPQPEHVKRCETGSDDTNRPERVAAVRAGERSSKNLILTEEAGQRWNSSDSKCGHGHHPEGDRGLLAQPAHAPHVLFAAHGMDYRAGAQEEQRFEKRVGHQMKNSGSVSSDSARHHHVPELRDGGISEDALDVGLCQPHGGSEDCGHAPDDGDNLERMRSEVEDRMR